jgi:hypothetical protein
MCGIPEHRLSFVVLWKLTCFRYPLHWKSLTHLLTHRAEPFLRRRQLCSHSITSQHFMETEGSLPCSQEPSTDPHPEPDQSNPYHPILHPPTSWSSQWSLTFLVSHQYPTCIPLLPHTCHMPCPSHPPRLDRSNYTWRRVQVMNLLKITIRKNGNM